MFLFYRRKWVVRPCFLFSCDSILTCLRIRHAGLTGIRSDTTSRHGDPEISHDLYLVIGNRVRGWEFLDLRHSASHHRRASNPRFHQDKPQILTNTHQSTRRGGRSSPSNPWLWDPAVSASISLGMMKYPSKLIFATVIVLIRLRVGVIPCVSRLIESKGKSKGRSPGH